MSSFFIWDDVDDIWLLFLPLSKFNESNEVNNREINDITKVIFYFNFFMTITPKLLIAIP